MTVEELTHELDELLNSISIMIAENKFLNIKVYNCHKTSRPYIIRQVKQ